MLFTGRHKLKPLSQERDPRRRILYSHKRMFIILIPNDNWNMYTANVCIYLFILYFCTRCRNKEEPATLLTRPNTWLCQSINTQEFIRKNARWEREMSLRNKDGLLPCRVNYIISLANFTMNKTIHSWKLGILMPEDYERTRSIAAYGSIKG